VNVKRRSKRPSAKPQRAAALLDGTFAWLKLDEQARSFRAMRAFSVAAGPRIAEHARAERLRGAILFVRCATAAWTQHLHVMKAQLIDKLARVSGGEHVREIRFTVGPLTEVPQWDEPAPDAPAAGRAGSDSSSPRVPDAIARAMSEVSDPELRDQLARLYARTLHK
jgi:predicted nucleic acid-binding Zn ribbon protein